MADRRSRGAAFLGAVVGRRWAGSLLGGGGLVLATSSRRSMATQPQPGKETVFSREERQLGHRQAPGDGFCSGRPPCLLGTVPPSCCCLLADEGWHFLLLSPLSLTPVGGSIRGAVGGLCHLPCVGWALATSGPGPVWLVQGRRECGRARVEPLGVWFHPVPQEALSPLTASCCLTLPC